MKKIIALTGCRSEYDILYALLKALDDDPAFDLSVLVSGAHLSDMFGYTKQEIEKDGFAIAGEIHNLLNSDRCVGKAKSAGLLISGLAEALHRENPDFVLVAGDREEVVAAGVACTYLQIPLIHVAGGDKTYPGEEAGDVDEPIRHAATKLAAIHFAMAEEHAERMRKMGEEPWRVACTGNPALDRFAAVPSMTREEVVEHFALPAPEKPIILVVQHVISSQHEEGAAQIRATLEALEGLDANVIVNYPNSDMGSQQLIDTIEHFREKPGFTITKNIPRIPFVNLLRNIDLLVGNSSMGLLEGSFLKFPVVNTGDRQKQRLNGGNVVFVPHDAGKIRETVVRILEDDAYRRSLTSCDQVYGDGTAAAKALAFLKNLKKTREELVSKDITY